MSKPSFLIEFFGRRSLSIVLLSCLLLTITIPKTGNSQAAETDRQEAFRQIVQSYIQAGEEEYEKGYYEQAEKTFLMAQGYSEYLTTAERKQLKSLLEKTQTAITKRKSALEIFRSVKEMIQQEEFSRAKKQLETIKDNEFLTADQRAQITQVLKHIDTQIKNEDASSEKMAEIMPVATEKSEQPESEPEQLVKTMSEQDNIPAVYNRSMNLYKAGQLKEARKGFVQVINSGTIPPEMEKTLNGYIAQIDEILAEREIQKPLTTAKIQTTFSEVIQPEMIATENVESVSGQGSYIDAVNQKRNIIRSHTKAVVSNAIAKAQTYMDQNKFDLAKNEIQKAEIIVNQNQMYLGDELYNQYKAQLQISSDLILQREKIQTQQQEQAKREASMEAQRQYREQMEIDRQNRIDELMYNTLTYRKQGRYEAALGQLESLLALDPQHEEALVMKDFLEDTIYFRKELEVERETNKQRAEILLQTDRSQIPYADELVYPKNWREIIARPTRMPDKPLGLSEADEATYEKLDTVVDLSELRPEMTFEDVLNRIMTKVDPPLQIQPNWKDLAENADVDRITPAGMDPLINVKIGTALDVLLAGLSVTDISELGYVVEEGVIIIATTDTLPSKMVNRVYDITDLVGQPSTGQMMFSPLVGFGFTTSTDISSGTGGTGGGGMGGMGGGMGGMGGGMGGMGGGMGGMGGGMGGMGGGMGGMGGMGGGYGGGMGGMGGGMGGMGGGYGGMGGGGGYGGMGGFGGQMSGYIAQDLVTLVQESIDPMSWYDLNEEADGSIFPYPTQQPKKLAVYNTPEVHAEIEKLLESLRKSLGHQVSIEARFLVVSENFLEDIGLDVDFDINLGTKWGLLSVNQDSYETTATSQSDVSLSLGGISASAAISGGYGSILDDLQVAFLIRATQAHRDAKSLNAPRATVLSGETVNFQLARYIIYALPPLQEAGTTTVGAATGTTTGTGGGLTPQYYTVMPGNSLYITPIITHDKKNVLLNINTTQNQFLGLRKSVVEIPTVTAVGGEGEVQTVNVEIPETEYLTISTRVNIPDGGTLLLGGQKITSEAEIEAGIPILSKLPVLGRLFRNTSKIRDQKILLVLVKSTILLQDEREAEAIGAMENGF